MEPVNDAVAAATQAANAAARQAARAGQLAHEAAVEAGRAAATAAAASDAQRTTEPTPRTAPAIDAVVAGLQSTVATLQSTFSHISNTLAANLAQSTAAIKTMSDAMEQLLQLSVHLDTVVRGRTAEGTEVAITVHNRSPLPLAAVHVTLRLVGVAPVAPGAPAPHDVSLPPVDLAAQTSQTVIAHLAPPQFGQYNVECRAEFASPASGRPLAATCQFGLYLLDQCVRRFVPRAASEGGAAAASGQSVERFPAALFRSLFAVPPEAGLAVGDAGSVERPDHGGSATARIAAAAGGLLTLEVGGTLPAIAAELQRLASAVAA